MWVSLWEPQNPAEKSQNPSGAKIWGWMLWKGWEWQFRITCITFPPRHHSSVPKQTTLAHWFLPWGNWEHSKCPASPIVQDTTQESTSFLPHPGHSGDQHDWLVWWQLQAKKGGLTATGVQTQQRTMDSTNNLMGSTKRLVHEAYMTHHLHCAHPFPDVTSITCIPLQMACTTLCRSWASTLRWLAQLCWTGWKHITLNTLGSCTRENKWKAFSTWSGFERSREGTQS